jgi:RND family efflux transporter MFP subunit
MSAHHDGDGDNAPRTAHESPVAHRADGALGFELPAPATLTPARGAALAVIALALLGGAFVAGYIPRRRASAQLARDARAHEAMLPRVEVVAPRALASERALTLPGSVRPLEEITVYPRANGYVRRWFVDIGDHVTEGELLAEIETPELDEELAQARAQLAQAQAAVLQATANRDFAATDLERYRQLAPAGMASRQDFEQRQASASVGAANLAVARAAVTAARANVARLVELRAFARVSAPFAGTITDRSIDRGALVAAGNATPLVHLAATDPVRVFVQVPQDAAPGVRAGLDAHVAVREYPGRAFVGQVARASGALDPASRTMTTEVRVPNGDGALLAGMYAEVSITLPLPHRVLELPSTAMLNDAHGLRVAVVDAGGEIRLVPIVLERDTGPTVQVASGLRGDERVVRVASAALSEGARVEVVNPAAR